MKKLSRKTKNYLIRRQHLQKKRQLRDANRIKHNKAARCIRNRESTIVTYARSLREHRCTNVYHKRIFGKPSTTVSISGEFGIEDPTQIDSFLDDAEKIVEANSVMLILDFKHCTRMWPSAVTLLCSLEQWVELTCRNSINPKIASTASQHDDVNAYLSHCGFYDYVKRHPDPVSTKHIHDYTVKIRREKQIADSFIENRENAVLDIVRKYSTLNRDQILELSCYILTEIFSNVTEHGKSNIDSGWWLIAQYHPQHGLISLCIADNGIGIRNTLATGPQRKEILGKYKDNHSNDGYYIKYAFKENVSGAIGASVASSFGRYKRGSRKGNGLNRIHSKCKDMGIQLSILSHHGFILYDRNGREIRCGSRAKKIFGGTMYHLVIPAYRKQEESGVNV